MKVYIAFINDEEAFATVVFIVNAQNMQLARMAVRKEYKKQFDTDCPSDMKVQLISEAFKLIPNDGDAIHLTTLGTTHKVVEIERTYNYTPEIEYA